MADKKTVAVYCDFSSVNDEELKTFEKLVAPHIPDCGKVRDESLCARALLKYVLCKFFDVKDFTILKAENGKPYLEGNNLYFNLSHCLKRVICTVSDSEVGCDVQDIRPMNEKVTKRFFACDECEALSATDKKDEHFTKLWTLKEAILKYKGEGISGGLDSYSFSDFLLCESFLVYGLNFHSFSEDGFIYGICSVPKNIDVFGADIKDILKTLM